jgi:hypothetical protein
MVERSLSPKRERPDRRVDQHPHRRFRSAL